MIELTKNDSLNFKLIALYSDLLNGVKSGDKNTCIDIVDQMLEAIGEHYPDAIQAEPEHNGFELKVELYRMQFILGNLGKNIIFYDELPEDSFTSFVQTIKVLKRYKLA